MSEMQDIRQWAKAQGMEVASRGKIPTSVMEQWETREVAEADGAYPETPPDHEPGGDTLETRPRVKRSFKGWWKDNTDPDKRGVAGKPSQRRVSIENVVSYAWGMGAYVVAQNPKALPVARCLDMQAPVAGIIVNDMAKGTPLDKLLQPVARAGEKGEKAMGLLGPPVIVGAITMNPNLYPVLRPALKLSIMSWLEISEPAMKKVQTRAAKFEEKFGGVDIDGMIDQLFAPPPGWQDAPSEAEDEAIRRARES